MVTVQMQMGFGGMKKYENLISMRRWTIGGYSACTWKYSRRHFLNEFTFTGNLVFGKKKMWIFNGNQDFWEDDQSDPDLETYTEESEHWHAYWLRRQLEERARARGRTM